MYPIDKNTKRRSFSCPSFGVQFTWGVGTTLSQTTKGWLLSLFVLSAIINLMKNTKKIILGVLLLLGFCYLVVFGRALKQEENHFGIALTLPKVILSSSAVRVDDKTYLTMSPADFFQEMKEQGFSHKKQLGAGYVFEKNNETFMSGGRKYSSHFMVFTYPVKIIK